MYKLMISISIVMCMSLPCFATSQKEVNGWNNLITLQESSIHNGQYSIAENILKDSIEKANEIAGDGGSFEYLIESCLRLSDIYRYEGRDYDALDLYQYLDSRINLDEKTYKLKTDLSIKINRLKTKIDNQNQAEEYQRQQLEIKNNSVESSKKSYDGTTLLRLSDLVNNVCNITKTIRYTRY